MPENKGTSVTNFAEELATLVCRRFQIPPNSLVWIEHYPAGPVHGPKPDWDLVTFERALNGNGLHFQNPHWRPMRPEDWQVFGIPPPQRRGIISEERPIVAPLFSSQPHGRSSIRFSTAGVSRILRESRAYNNWKNHTNLEFIWAEGTRVEPPMQ